LLTCYVELCRSSRGVKKETETEIEKVLAVRNEIKTTILYVKLVLRITDQQI
jgi:hypothetical protein